MTNQNKDVAHTPGPWEAYYVSSAGWSVRMAQPREGYTKPDPICSMAWWQFDIPGIIDNDISGANARLIAAAPEMLELLEEIIGSGVAFDDPRLRYMEVQLHRDTIMAARKLLGRIKDK